MNISLGIQQGKLLSLPPKGPVTIHQRALLWFWLTALALYFTRLFVRFFGPFSGVKYHVIEDEELNKVIINDTKEIHKDENLDIDKTNNGHEKQTTAHHPPSKPSAIQPTEPTFDKFLEAISILGAIMFYFYICDYEHYFPAAPRVYSRDLYIFLFFILMAVGALFTTRECSDKLLNRDQTEEWKGVMQVLFVWYHYFKAAETYNAIRVFIAAYVWMTGFGNFSFFWVRNDFSLYRVMKMMFRLNFLVIVTCLVTANEYMLYYICAMHTFWFVSVYLCMRPLNKRNVEPKIMALKFAMHFGIVLLLFDVPNVGKLVFQPLTVILKYKNSLHEWMFRAGLDHYCTILGMIIAYFHPNLENLLAQSESVKTSRKRRLVYLLVKIAIALCFLVLSFAWVRHIFVLDKYAYNKLHPYFSFIPLFMYMYLRNMFPWLRSKYMHLFAWLGKITLETYISQLHILMQGNAKYLIVYIPGYPLVNFTLATSIYLFMSYHLFHVTVDLSAYMITKDFKAMGRKGVVGVAWLGVCYVMGAFCI